LTGRNGLGIWRRTPAGIPMEAIYAIAIFIVVIALINRIEFGRFD
jgi:ribose/xylose/arabinose/galactoside ABC-type transport system permease subunit